MFIVFLTEECLIKSGHKTPFLNLENLGKETNATIIVNNSIRFFDNYIYIYIDIMYFVKVN